MEYFILFFLVALIFGMKALISFLNDKDRKSSLSSLPYVRKKYFLTDTEKVFYSQLTEWFQSQYYIFPQVSIASIIDIKQADKKYYTHLNKIDRKSIDFVFFDKVNMLPILAIELDDYTHSFARREERDMFVDAVFKVANMPIAHITSINNPVNKALIESLIIPVKPVYNNIS